MMKRVLFALVIASTAALAVAADVGLSVNIGDPNFYGQITLGNAPRPRLIYPQPAVVVRDRRHYEPIYLRVPPNHARNWKQYCRRYNACARPVYFVRDDWYRNEYAPRYRHDHHKGHGKRRRDD